MGRKKIEIKPGTRFGRLIVIEEVEPYFTPKGYKCRKFKLQCDCGNIVEVFLSGLRSGHTQSCGCRQREIIAIQKTKHGYSNHPAYSSYSNMMRRCYDIKCRDYSDYGGRDITVCDEWRNHPEVFCTWADANGFEKGLTIDRIDPNGNYCPDNCRWLTNAEQQRNRRDNRHVIDSLTGEEYFSALEASAATGIPENTIYAQICGKVKKPRFISYQALNTHKRCKVKCLETGEVFNTTGEVARKYNIARVSFQARLKRSVSVFIKKLGLTFSFMKDDEEDGPIYTDLLDLGTC